MKHKPRKDRVLIELLKEEEVSKGGIIIPDSAREKSQEGKVIAIGPGTLNDSGKLIPVDLKIGDIVLMPKYGGTEIKLNGKEYQIIREDDILMVIG